MKEADFSDIQARLKREGAAFAGVQVSLAWNTCDDLDLHVIEPSGAVINYKNRKSSSGGKLDIDMNRDDDNISMQPVENIVWPDGAARKGRYSVQVHLYKRRSHYMLSVPFQVMVKNQGTMMRFNGQVSHGKVDVTDFKVHRPWVQDFGALFKGTFKLSFTALNVKDKMRLKSFSTMILATLGAKNLTHFNAIQLNEMDRLKKLLDRIDDVQNYAGERANAARVLQAALGRLDLQESAVRNACGSLDADAAKPSLACLEFTKRLTSRRRWFEKHAARVALPMGVAVTANRAKGHFGRIGHNGVGLVGKPAAVLLAAAVISKTAEAAMESCDKTDKDSFCASFCAQLRWADSSEPEARKAQLAASQRWLTNEFGCACGDASWNPAKGFRTDTPTAEAGRAKGTKRKPDFESEFAQARKHHVRALVL